MSVVIIKYSDFSVLMSKVSIAHSFFYMSSADVFKSSPKLSQYYLSLVTMAHVWDSESTIDLNFTLCIYELYEDVWKHVT